MAEKKKAVEKKSEKKSDRHVSPRFMAQVPKRYRAGLEALATRNHRNLIGEISVALDRYFASEGITPDDE